MSWSSRRSAWALAALLALLPSGRAVAQVPRREIQVMVAGLASEPAVGLAGLGLNWREGRGRSRAGLALLGGAAEDGRAAARAELVWHFQLDPARQRGWGLYGGGGIAATVVEDDRVRPWIQAVVGAESRPGGRGGLFVETGFGGGFRLAAGWRWRKQNAPGR
jgi:hypothetical protein